MSRVAVIDYGMGNLHSASKALSKVKPDGDVVITSSAEEILAADRVVFPGVGAIRDCMGEILRLELDEVVKEAAKTKPFIAICVGMQCLLSHSEENDGVDCLDILPGDVKFFGTDLKDEQGEKLKVPHMGWNQVKQSIDHPLWQGIEDNSRFYFVHSFYAQMQNQALVSGEGNYGLPFAAALAKDNVFAVQFHPEKSATAGLTLLKNFLHWDGQA